MDPYVGEIRAVAFNFAPVGWMLCQGQLLPVNQYAALFSLLGTTYGGNGTTNFALPNLQGRIAVGSGTGTGLSQCTPGEQAGVASVTLLTGNLAAHIHSIPVSPAAAAGSAAPGPQTLLGGAVAAHHTGGTSYYVTPTVQAGAVAQMANVVQPAGSNMPHNNMAPFLAMQYVIALQGIFPQRP